jgi:hypothetical protein
MALSGSACAKAFPAAAERITRQINTQREIVVFICRLLLIE